MHNPSYLSHDGKCLNWRIVTLPATWTFTNRSLLLWHTICRTVNAARKRKASTGK